MSWSYSGNPSSSGKDQVRFLVGDTKKCDQLLTDEEIEFLISQEGSVMKAAAMAAQSIAASFSRLSDETVGAVSVSLSQRSKQYFELAKKLEVRSSLEGLAPYSGGISVSDKEIQNSDPDRTTSIFKRHMQETQPEILEDTEPGPVIHRED